MTVPVDRGGMLIDGRQIARQRREQAENAAAA
jgi:hypothetical protein